MFNMFLFVICRLAELMCACVC